MALGPAGTEAARIFEPMVWYNNRSLSWVEHRFRTRLQKLCRSLNYTKKDRTSSYLGCSKLEFKQHIESLFRDGMTWDNKNLWVLDHVKPCCAYNLTNEDELKECFNFKNIQPLWYFENEQKIKTDILWKLQKQK